jgi:Flp pilus assembly pilin Flp
MVVTLGLELKYQIHCMALKLNLIASKTFLRFRYLEGISMKTSTKKPVRRYAAMTEYIIILALVAIGSIAIFNIFGDQIRNVVGASSKQMGGDSSAQNEMVGDPDSEVSKSLDSF